MDKYIVEKFAEISKNFEELTDSLTLLKRDVRNLMDENAQLRKTNALLKRHIQQLGRTLKGYRNDQNNNPS